MKTIKLFLIFTFVLGGIIAILYFANRQDSTTIVVVDSHSLQQYREQFEEEWEAVGDWNEETFKNHSDLIRQLGANGYDVSALYDLNTSTAVNVVYEHILSEWGKATCKKQIVERYMSAIDTIVASEERASQNPSVKLIMGINTIYQKAVGLANKSIGLSPRFDGNGWNSYDNYASGIESQKKIILTNGYYERYLSNIQEIKNGLESIPSKLSSGRTRFYESLADCIIQHYSRVPREERTRDELEHLRRMIRRYENEFHSVSLLSKFSSQYAKDVTYNEETETREKRNNVR